MSAVFYRGVIGIARVLISRHFTAPPITRLVWLQGSVSCLHSPSICVVMARTNTDRYIHLLCIQTLTMHSVTRLDDVSHTNTGRCIHLLCGHGHQRLSNDERNRRRPGQAEAFTSPPLAITRTVRCSFFGQDFALEGAIGSYVCSLDTSMRVIQQHASRVFTLCPVDAVHSVQTLKAITITRATFTSRAYPNLCCCWPAHALPDCMR
jgi:hypothetical protein